MVVAKTAGSFVLHGDDSTPCEACLGRWPAGTEGREMRFDNGICLAIYLGGLEAELSWLVMVGKGSSSFTTRVELPKRNTQDSRNCANMSTSERKGTETGRYPDIADLQRMGGRRLGVGFIQAEGREIQAKSLVEMSMMSR